MTSVSNPPQEEVPQEKTRASKRKRVERDAEELKLTKKLFGKVEDDASDVSHGGDSSDEEFQPDDEDNKEEIAVWEDNEEESLKPAWVDSDDEEARVDLRVLDKRTGFRRAEAPSETVTGVEYQERLKVKYERMVSRGAAPKWAQIEEEKKKKPEDSDDEEVEETVEFMTLRATKYITKGHELFKGAINFNRLRDITTGHSSGGSITKLKFHPSKPVMITGSDRGALTLYQVPDTSEESSLKTDFFLQDMKFFMFPITSLELYRQSTALLLGSNRQSYMFSYDLIEGDISQIDRPRHLPAQSRCSNFKISCGGKYVAIASGSGVYVYTANSFEYIHTFIASSGITSLHFSTCDENVIFALTEAGKVFIWDIVRRGEQRFFTDEGAVRGSSLAIGRQDAFVACGSNTGIVNVYKTSEAYQKSEPKPFATYSNLTTEIDILAFNHDSQAIAFGSTVKFNSIRLGHTKSGSVYQNFPNRTEMMQKTQMSSCAFSPNSGFFACGTQNGNVRLYRLDQFDNY
ncbi:hypothetical protein L596_015636 [Steinernema carpocapsae]|uniref:U3 small nucleolar RNA-associated protein 18 homolog n=1 Tax=Steinernema carpocapsae TaxID=34508 RepID=A0A4U5NGK2_STECR|nr:hypothetical protein L596_015636 [Steinernema carpocapsae]